MLVDTHCHLNFESFDQDRDWVISKAREAGLIRILIPGITYQSSLDAIRISRQYPDVYAAVGIHPTMINAYDSGTMTSLQQLLPDPKVVAIGEIGLDDYWDRTTFDQQIFCFQEMLDLSANFYLPVSIHIRNHVKVDHKATEAAYNILSEWYGKLPDGSNLKSCPGVLHSFDDDYSWAEKFLNINFMFGISGRVTYRNAHVLREVIIKTPLQNLLLETDAPYVTPEPDRRKRNQPDHVKAVAEQISKLKGVPYEVVASITTSNAGRLFAW